MLECTPYDASNRKPRMNMAQSWNDHIYHNVLECVTRYGSIRQVMRWTPNLLSRLQFVEMSKMNLFTLVSIVLPTSRVSLVVCFSPSVKSRRAMSRLFSTEESCNLWSYEDPVAFANLEHVGRSSESDPVTHVGGWLPHRASHQSEGCWIQEHVVGRITQYEYSQLPIGRPPRLLILYGSLRETSFSRKLGLEFARLFEVLGCDVRVYNPRGLPVRDPTLEDHIKVQELRALTQWSDGHVWISPEMHGTITGVFKNQIDWIPLNTGSVRPTQGRTCLVAQVNGGSQSFNAVNALRILARWMRMPCCTNQSSIAKAWMEFDEAGRMKESDFRDRVVDCAEEMAKFTALMTPAAGDLNNRFSERKEFEKEGKLLTQAEKEATKT